MPESEYVCTTVNGIPVVVTAAEIDITTAEQLRAALLKTASARNPIVLVDMSQTRFCDSSGLHVLIRAHNQAAGEGRELRLIVPPDGTVPRVITLTGVGGVLNCYSSQDEALASTVEGEPTT